MSASAERLRWMGLSPPTPAAKPLPPVLAGLLGDHADRHAELVSRLEQASETARAAEQAVEDAKEQDRRAQVAAAKAGKPLPAREKATSKAREALAEAERAREALLDASRESLAELLQAARPHVDEARERAVGIRDERFREALATVDRGLEQITDSRDAEDQVAWLRQFEMQGPQVLPFHHRPSRTASEQAVILAVERLKAEPEERREREERAKEWAESTAAPRMLEPSQLPGRS